jgi:histidinol-phosphate phosphatase family protein
MARAGVLLDRDGTIIVDHGYVGSVDRVELIEGSAQAIAAFNRANIPVAVVTNQAGVARGYYSTDDVDKVHEHLATLLAAHGAHVDRFLFCPYHPDGTVATFARQSFDRKPAPGMAFAAAQALDMDLSASWVIGDRPEDMELAAAVGASGVFVGPDAVEHEGIWSFPDLGSAAQFILHRMNTTNRDGRPLPLRTPTPGARPKFPRIQFDEAASYCRAYVSESARAARSVDFSAIERASEMLVEAYRRGAVVFACGNGGSASIANHLQCDHLKGVRTGTDLCPRVVSLSSNVELMTAIANDISYEDVFVYQLQSQARPGDVLVVISSSGESANVVRALDWARGHDVQTIALTGFGGGKARELADVGVHVDSANYGVVEDNHQAIMHALAQYIRQSLMTPDAVAIHSF